MTWDWDNDKRTWIIMALVLILIFVAFYFLLKMGFSKTVTDGFNNIIIAFDGTPLPGGK